uniref:Ig-like domain-containing protein n=1 Tax=Cyprinodon variegatus TaxID=28743 RepID=A0A3Q2G2J0_CYPVA
MINMSLKPGTNLLIMNAFSSHVNADYLEVLYPQKTITAVRGSTVKLSCEANYDYKKCGIVHVVWHKIKEEGENSFELTDPSQYFTTVNETITYGNMRCRQVETEIMSVQSPHNGRYQCKATCKSGEQAMGHFITVNIKGNWKKNLNTEVGA